MKKLLTVLILGIMIVAVGCTANNRAKNWGGSQTITLEEGQRLVNATWKEDNMWLLVKTDTTKPQIYHFNESSSWGLLEGEITIIEK